MPLLIDGHNLLGAGVFDDIQLSDEDDEAKLVARLRVWKSRYNGNMTVIFDRGIPGGVSRKMSGSGVKVVFAADPAQADDLIRRRLRRAERGLILVSNDAALVRIAHQHGVATYSGREFVTKFELKETGRPAPDVDPDLALNDEEVAEWMRVFGQQKRKRRKKRTGDRVKKSTSSKKQSQPAHDRQRKKRAQPRFRGSSSKGQK